MPVQTSYTFQRPIGYAGYFYDTAPKDVLSAPAAETIPFGVLLELQTDGTVRVYRGTGKIAGISIGRDMREGGSLAEGATAAWKQYEQVPFLRRGRMFVQFESNAASVALLAPNVWTPSTNGSGNLAKLGVFTSRATSATTGAEVTAVAAGALFFKVAALSDTIAVVEVSLS